MQPLNSGRVNLPVVVGGSCYSHCGHYLSDCVCKTWLNSQNLHFPKPQVPDAEGSLLLLGSEAKLGPRPVTLRLWVDSSEGQVDARASVMVLFSHLMLPIVLCGSLHQ